MNTSHCAIRDFLELSPNFVVSLHTHRYGGSIIAMIVYADSVSKFVDSFEDNNGETEWELWGLADSWYPAAYADSVNGALNCLRDKLQACRDSWSIIHFGMEQLTASAPHPVASKSKCNVMTLGQLQLANDAWNHGPDEINFF